MGDRKEIEGLKVDTQLADFVNDHALPGTGVDPNAFWSGLSSLIHDFGPRNRELLSARDDMQSKIDEWHRTNRDFDPAAYKAFLSEIGYLVEEGGDFQVETTNVDPEFASTPGPQLVVPVMNARYALNAANARWGSLYDALYGTDAMGDGPQGGGYDASRGARVVGWAKAFLDDVAPLQGASHADVTEYRIMDGGLGALTTNGMTTLEDQSKFAGFTGKDVLEAVLLKNNSLHIEIVIDRSHNIGSTDPAGVADVMMEAAVSTIMDCEDSVRRRGC